MVRITLDLDAELVERVQRLAEQNRTTVSAMVAQLVMAMAEERKKPNGPTPLTDLVMRPPHPPSTAQQGEEAVRRPKDDRT